MLGATRVILLLITMASPAGVFLELAHHANRKACFELLFLHDLLL